MDRRIVAAMVAVLLAVAAVGVAVVATRPRPRFEAIERPNVVLVIGCTVRRDQTTPYGGPPDTTPYLASVAADGARFDDALATSSWTREAVAGLLTGAPAATWGLPDPRPGESPRVLVDEAATLAEALRDAGWHTVGVTANPNLNVEFGMAQGFERYLGAAPTQGFARRNRQHGEGVVAAGLELLDARTAEERARPFLLELVLIDVHSPRAPRKAEVAPFADPSVPPDVQEYRALLRRLDGALADLDEGLAARGHGPDDTLFVFVADHGEGLNHPEHHRGGHGKRMYPSTVAIPWIVRGPGIPPGVVVRGLASGEDVAPTLLALAGVPAPPTMVGRDWSGLVVRGGTTDRDRVFSLSMFQGADVASIWTDERQCQLDFGSRGSDPPMNDGCFDRATDPWFAVAKTDPRLPDELRAWREARLAEGAGHVVRDAVAEEGTAEQLEALGYVE